jgi:hypothetical protein
VPSGEQALTLTPPIPDDEIVAAELARLDRKIVNSAAEKLWLVDLFQAGLIEMLNRSAVSREVASRHNELTTKSCASGSTHPSSPGPTSRTRSSPPRNHCQAKTVCVPSDGPRVWEFQ